MKNLIFATLWVFIAAQAQATPLPAPKVQKINDRVYIQKSGVSPDLEKRVQDVFDSL